MITITRINTAPIVPTATMMKAIGISGGSSVGVVVPVVVVSVGVVVGDVVVVVLVVVTGSSVTVMMTVSIKLYPDSSFITSVRL